MRSCIIAGNWKMNKAPSDCQDFFEIVEANTPGDRGKVRALVAMPFTHLPLVKSGTSFIEVAAQNMHWEQSGAYTGEVSGKMLTDLGVGYVILGHSERRTLFGETNEDVARKVDAAINEGITPILCVGETQEQREQGKTFDVIRSQLEACFSKISDLSKVLIAYEPVWAIGTGLSATKEQAQEVHKFIRSVSSESFPAGQVSDLCILYGGSVKPSNVSELLQQEDIDGALVGGASLDPHSFAELIQSGKKIYS